MSNRISIKTWLENYKSGQYSSPDVHTQCEAGWYDWFCKDSSLGNKTKTLASKVNQCAEILGSYFQDSHYVFFKNNCPMVGGLYDDFRFCDMKTGDVVFTITPNHDGQSEIWGRKNDFHGPLYKGNWKGALEYLKQVVAQ